MGTLVLTETIFKSLPFIGTVVVTVQVGFLISQKVFVGLDLERVLKDSYLNWFGIDVNKSNKREYLEKMKYKSHFIYLTRALQDIYNIYEEISLESWETYSDAIHQSHSDSTWHKRILREKCNYERIMFSVYTKESFLKLTSI